MARSHIGYETSVDPVQPYYTKPTNGVKRSYEQVNGNANVSWDIAGHTTTVDIIATCHERAKPRIEASKISATSNRYNRFDSDQGPSRLPIAGSGPSQNALLLLSNARYSLPETLVKNFARLGINSIYPWQSSCLLGRGLLEGQRNLVYSAPTGGGKSLVADVLMLKKVVDNPSKKAILVLPFVALVQEKLKWLRKVVEGVPKNTLDPKDCTAQKPQWRKAHDQSVRVVGFYGGSKARATWADVDVAVCTIEKVMADFICTSSLHTLFSLT